MVDFAKEAARKITDQVLSKHRGRLKVNTGVAPDLLREQSISTWKGEMADHERKSPLVLDSPHFFLPTNRISITSEPTREQDVIALFNQLIAGGIIRGIRIMSTNERFTYDGLFKISFDLSQDKYEFDNEKNPLGIASSAAAQLSGLVTDPKILEYKFSLDGLVEDFETGDKNMKDIALCVVWETGAQFRARFGITSLLIPENVEQRQFHGLTHVLKDLDAGQRVFDLIVLSELVAYLNDKDTEVERQRGKYE